jgi:putative ABC transport system permease protein
MTMSGVSLSVLLMGFLLALYRGVEEGSVAYLRDTQADAWVLQEHTTNILRGFSLLTRAHGTLLTEQSAIGASAPVLFRLTAVETPRGTATLYLAGFDPAAAMGGPLRLVEGRNVRGNGEIVLDEAFARTWRLRVGDRMPIQGTSFQVVGLSDRTNMVVIQYAFATLADVQQLYGVSDLVSVYAVRRRPDISVDDLVRSLSGEIPGAQVMTNEVFVAQNLREMRSGFLPVLMVLAVVGIVALGAIVGLLLMLDVLERRTDLAVLKAIGAPSIFLPGFVVVEALVVMGVGLIIAGAAAIPLASAVRTLAPEVAAVISFADLMGLVVGLLAIALISTVVPLRRLRTIYPTEAFQ